MLGQPLGMDEEPLPADPERVVRSRYELFRNCPSYVHFYRTEVLAAVQGFDESLGVGSGTPWQSGEKTDFLLRVAQAGYKVWCVPAAVVRHPRTDLRLLQRAKVLAYAAGRMRLLRKHGCACPFVLANVVYPLAVPPYECLTAALRIARYRWAMFWGRLCGLWNGQ